MTKIIYGICIVILFYAIPSLGQGKLDTFYIQSTFHTPTVALQSTYKDFKLTFSSEVTHPVVLENSNLSLGIRIKYKKVGFALAVPVAFFNRSPYGQPEAFGVGFHLLPAQYLIQGSFQYIKGFDDLNFLATEPDAVFQPESRMIYANLIGNYIFNHQKFSLRSGFKMMDIQKRSAGSWLASIPINYQHFKTDSLSLPLKNQPDFQFDLYRSFKIGVGGGYAYTKVWGSWSATLFMTGGVEFRSLKYRSSNSDNAQNEFLLSPRIRLVSSIVYNKPTHFVGVVWRYLPGLEITDGLNARVENLSIRLLVGKRF